MKNSALHENSSLDAGDCLVFSAARLQPGSPAPRCIGDYELTLLPAALHAKLTIGDMALVLSGLQLVLLAPAVPHSWSSMEGTLAESPASAPSKARTSPSGLPKSGTSSSGRSRAGVSSSGPALAETPPSPLVLRWPGDLLGDRFLGKNQLHPIGMLLQNAQRGVVFSPETASSAESLLEALRKKSGFESVHGLLSLLHHLSVASGSRPVADKVYAYPHSSAGDGRLNSGDSRLNSAVAYMRANYSHPITLEEVARKARMTKGAFCRSIRKRTGKTYAESLNEIRINQTCRRLLNSSDTVSEIAFQAGYNNVTHFHRSFKRLKGCTPKEFRQNGA
ncbi:MAG TPA: AraC family transcriptional regulator [Puia sp.]|nr:AraC family transcriptional regulator [Puia sp.]